ncbi:acyltransferase [endosymbiont of Lamellibrachia barhami]|uniref:DUF7931 domain-containing protein n=1 Tax=endosymbiont of Lamellibrachia barhami TaxID=205975 RepID=UPI0015B1CC7E|nr:acyltransferase [endosymbiont of Lamellibrachia barhami]
MPDQAPTFQNAILGVTSDTFYLHNPGENLAVASRLVEQAKRELQIFTRNLDPQIFDKTGFLEPFKRLALNSRFARIRILLQDNSTIQKTGHRLATLAQRLTTTIEIRKSGDTYQQFPENFMLVDGCGYLHRTQPTRYDAVAAFNARPRVHQLTGIFDEAWETGEPDAELWRLHL